MKTIIIKATLVILLVNIAWVFNGCKKQDSFLDAKRLQEDVTPQTLADLQATLDWSPRVNSLLSSVGLIGSDNFHLSDANFAGASQLHRNLYIWQKDNLWAGASSADWTNSYTLMEYANIVLDGLAKLDSKQPGYNNVKGEALFYRAFSLYTLAQVFCKPYITDNARTDLGIPIRLTSDVNVIYQRGTLEQTYKQMISDATMAISLLDHKPLTIYRPCNTAAMALLSKIYLVMGDYTNAGVYADRAISSGTALLDYNNSSIVSTATTYRFPSNGLTNPEVIFYGNQGSYSVLAATSSTKGSVDPDLYKLYGANDLPKTLFYAFSAGTPLLRGTYNGAGAVFCGIATDELYLIRAECYARTGNTKAAMEDLNTLLKNRFVKGTFTDLTAPDGNAALQIILQERRKELPLTSNIRWEDLRRLNLDIRFQVTLTRRISGVTYTLPPNDPRYVLPIPDNEIQLSGLIQNPR